MNNFTRFLVLKGLQSVTVNNHLSGIKRIQRSVGTLSKETAEQYVTNLYLSEYSYSYKTNSVKSLEHYFEFLGMPIRFGRQRKPKHLVRNTLNEADITKLIFSTVNSRERAIIALLAYGGLRPKEICRLRRRDINLALGQVTIEQGKGAKDGTVFLTSRCLELLMPYLTEHTRPDEQFLFTALVSGKPYSQCALRKLIKILGKRAKIIQRVYPYLLRHSLATNMIKRGANLLYIKEHFRHAFLETTLLYIHSVSVAELQEQFIPHYS